MTNVNGKVEKILRAETKITWGIITVLLMVLAAVISRDTMNAQMQTNRDSISSVKQNVAVQEEKIKRLEAMDGKIEEIRLMMLNHILTK